MRKTVLAIVALASICFVSVVHALDEQNPSAKVGSPAPDFSLQDQNGNTVSLADLKGKIVVLEWVNPNCPFVVRHYQAKTFPTLAEKYAQNDVVWLAINTTTGSTADDNKAWVEKHGLKYPILDDSAGNVGRAYGAKTTPHMFIINKDGVLVYAAASIMILMAT